MTNDIWDDALDNAFEPNEVAVPVHDYNSPEFVASLRQAVEDIINNKTHTALFEQLPGDLEVETYPSLEYIKQVIEDWSRLEIFTEDYLDRECELAHIAFWYARTQGDGGPDWSKSDVPALSSLIVQSYAGLHGLIHFILRCGYLIGRLDNG